MPYTDTEMLDWMSRQSVISFERHYNGLQSEWNDAEKKFHGFDGTIDFFSVPSQHIKGCANLRTAIHEAMKADVTKTLQGQSTPVYGPLLDPGYPPQKYA